MELYDTDLTGFASDLRLDGLADSTVSNYLSCLRRWREHAEGPSLCGPQHGRTGPSASTSGGTPAEYCVDDWSRQVPCREPRDRPPQSVATEESFQAMLRCCEGDRQRVEGLRDIALLQVLRTTGMRRSEVARMERDDIGLSDGVLTIPKTKTKRARTVRLNRSTLKNRRYTDELSGVWVSLSRRAVLRADSIGEVIIKRAEHAGVDVSARSFRRGFAVDWLRGGGSETYLRESEGWESPRMVARCWSDGATPVG